MHSYCFAHWTFCLVTLLSPLPVRGLLKLPTKSIQGYPNQFVRSTNSTPVNIYSKHWFWNKALSGCLGLEKNAIIRAWTTEDFNTLNPVEQFKESSWLYHLSSFCHFLDISYNFFLLLFHLSTFSIKISEKRPSSEFRFLLQLRGNDCLSRSKYKNIPVILMKVILNFWNIIGP